MDEELTGGIGGPVHGGPPGRHEAARLARLDRDERRARGERARERAARERTRPWREGDAPDLRRRVWRERRDAQWATVDRRERQPPPDAAPPG